MDIGSSVAVFLVLALIILALFCLLTKYFHHKFTQNMEQAAQIYSTVDQTGGQDMQSQLDGNYDKFKQLELQKINKAESKKRSGYEEIQMAQMAMKRPLKNTQEDLYSPNILKNRLNSNLMIPKYMQTGRSMSSLKQYKPDKLITMNKTNRSNRDGNDANSSLNNKKDKRQGENNTNYHIFINKMVCYDCQGITVVQVDVTSIKKVSEGIFKENKKVKTYATTTNQKGLDNQLEIFGFEKGEFGCFKYLTKVSTEYMKINDDYTIKSLKTCEVKQSMQVEDYLRIKRELQSNF